jgi:pyruvate kinase
LLSGETTNGENPSAAVSIMPRKCYEVERAINFDSLYQAVQNSTLKKYGHLSTPESIVVVKAAIDISA